MPIYEYSCSRCKETIEVIQKMSDPDLKKHKGCGGTLTKLFSVPTIQMKQDDSGFPPEVLKHPSVERQTENERRRIEKIGKPARIINGPGRRTSPKKTTKKSK